MSFPIVIAQFFHPDYTTIGGKILMLLNSSYWFRPEMPAYSVGLVIYLVLIVLFAYFYTSITFNPLEVANNMKKSGGFIPGIRPGKPTSEYLDKILNYIVFIGGNRPDHCQRYSDHHFRSIHRKPSVLHGYFPDHYCQCYPGDHQGY